MTQRHFQVIILGDSLACRLAGVLLAKRGVRVLSFQRNGLSDGLWFQSSLLLERILDLLGGRSCYTAPIPLQVITPESRLEIHGQYPLDEELHREFPAVHTQVAATLESLSQAADRVEDRLWQIGFLPLYGLASRWGFNLRRPGLRGLNRPLTSLLGQFDGTPARQALTTLFSGLSLVSAEHLTVAEGALLWGGAVQSRGVSPSGLDALLRHRYDQFHGESEDLAGIQSLAVQGGRVTEVLLRNGSGCSADRYLIENPDVWSLLPEDWRKAIPEPAAPPVFAAAMAETQVPHLVAPRLILAGDPPVRLGLVVREGQVRCTIKTPIDARQIAPEEIQGRLAAVFPSVPKPVLSQQGRSFSLASKPPFPGAHGPLRLRGNALFCHAGSVFPTLGTIGEVLSGLSSANRLLRELKQT